MRLVRCEATGQYLALKAIKKADILRMHQVQHIANEKDILASLHHPFIVDLCALTATMSQHSATGCTCMCCTPPVLTLTCSRQVAICACTDPRSGKSSMAGFLG